MLESILTHIDRVYGLELEVDIRDFLITGEVCAHFGADPRHSKVLVRQDKRGGELELGVYIDEEKLDRLREIDLSARMTSESFETLATAIEEVSHFAYLLFSASRERFVTELELELQAEVDKFVTATLLLASRNRGRVPKDLLDRLFGDFEVRAEIDGGRRERYEAASSLASRYCSYFVQTELSRGRFAKLLPELRSFYRLSQRGKIGRIQHLVYTA
jgi:hypothetical protein